MGIDDCSDPLAITHSAIPWIRHLRDDEVRSFARELGQALACASGSCVGGAAREVVEGWRATARIKADRGLYQEAQEPTEGHHGRVEIGD